MDKLILNAFTAVPHLIQHSFTPRNKMKEGENRNAKVDELVITVITNNISACKRGRSLLHPTVMEGKETYIEIASWPFEVSFAVEDILNKKYLSPKSLIANIKFLHLTNIPLEPISTITDTLLECTTIDTILFLIPPAPLDHNNHWIAALPSSFDEDQLNPQTLNALRNKGITVSLSYKFNHISDSPLFDSSRKDFLPPSLYYDAWLNLKLSSTPPKLSFKQPWSNPLPEKVKAVPLLQVGQSSSTTNLTTKNKSNTTAHKMDELTTVNGLSSQFMAFQSFITETKNLIKEGAEDRNLLRTIAQELAYSNKTRDEARARDKKEADEMRRREIKASNDAAERRDNLLFTHISNLITPDQGDKRDSKTRKTEIQDSSQSSR